MGNKSSRMRPLELPIEWHETVFSGTRYSSFMLDTLKATPVNSCSSHLGQCQGAVSGQCGELLTWNVTKDIFCRYHLRKEEGWPLLKAMSIKYDQKQFSLMESEGYFESKEGKYIVNPSRTRPIAESFVNAFYENGTLRYYAGEFYKWEDNVYRLIDEHELYDSVLRFLTNNTARPKVVEAEEGPNHVLRRYARW